MRCEIGGVERGVVQRDRLNQALERKQRGAGAAILRSRSLSILIVAGADEERHRLGRIDCDVSRCRSWRGGPGRCRRRRGIAIVSLAGFIQRLSTWVALLKVTATYVRASLTAAGTIVLTTVSAVPFPMVNCHWFCCINIERKACAVVGTCGKHNPIESRYGPSGLDPGFECEVGQRWRIRRPRNADVTSFEIDAGWQILASASERVAGHNRSLVQIKRWIEINRWIAHRC